MTLAGLYCIDRVLTSTCNTTVNGCDQFHTSHVLLVHYFTLHVVVFCSTHQLRQTYLTNKSNVVLLLCSQACCAPLLWPLLKGQHEELLIPLLCRQLSHWPSAPGDTCVVVI